MKKFSLKALGAILLATGLVVAGVAAPASAAGLTVTAISTGGTVGNSGTNAYPITVTFTPMTAGSDDINILFPTGWTPVNSSTTCANTTVNSPQGPINCLSFNTIGIDLNRQGTAFSTSAIIVVEFGPGTLNVNSNRIFTVNAYSLAVSMNNPVDTGTATLAASGSTYGANYSPNGGSGTSITPGSSSSGTITLPVCSFTKPGFTCAGWTSGAPNTGTVYAGGTSAPLTATTTFYASWTANSATPSGGSTDSTLANTGIDSSNMALFLLGGLSLAMVGATMIMIARRNRSN